jgi:hypothetical protein
MLNLFFLKKGELEKVRPLDYKKEGVFRLLTHPLFFMRDDVQV